MQFQAAEALFATALLPRARLFVEPFIDLDRTMDVGQGLLDSLCNPRPVFGVLRCLNALLQRFRVPFAEATSLESDGATARLIQGPTRTLALLLPAVAGTTVPSALGGNGIGATLSPSRRNRRRDGGRAASRDRTRPAELGDRRKLIDVFRAVRVEQLAYPLHIIQT